MQHFKNVDIQFNLDFAFSDIIIELRKGYMESTY